MKAQRKCGGGVTLTSYNLTLRSGRVSIISDVDMSCKEAEELLIRYLPELHKGIISPVSLAVELLSCGLIPRKVYNDAISYDGTVSTEQKIHAICGAVLKSVAIKPTLLVEFVEVAEDNSPGMSDVCAKIKREPLYIR